MWHVLVVWIPEALHVNVGLFLCKVEAEASAVTLFAALKSSDGWQDAGMDNVLAYLQTAKHVYVDERFREILFQG